MKIRILKKINCEKGSIDKVIVTLFLILVSIVALVGIERWYAGQQEGSEDEASLVIQRALE